ncbi:MAG: NfeD family protein [Christensenellaceae bacterium]|nr:NfeD family protein [Christensenellaceae bacterium]
MAIVWSLVVAASLITELATMTLIALWFVPAGVVSLLIALFAPASLAWQICAFVIISVIGILLLKPLLKKVLPNKTTPTNVDANVGQKAVIKLENGKPTIKIGDIVWYTACDEELADGDAVEIKGAEGNKMLVAKIKKGEK